MKMKRWVITYAWQEVDVCGIFLPVEFPFLGTSPDGITYIDIGKIALVEIKCPYKHCHDSIVLLIYWEWWANVEGTMTITTKSLVS